MTAPRREPLAKWEVTSRRQLEEFARVYGDGPTFSGIDFVTAAKELLAARAEIARLTLALTAQGERLAKAEAALRDLTIECGLTHEGLTKYAVDNYPDNDGPITEPETQAAVRLAHAAAQDQRGGGDNG